MRFLVITLALIVSACGASAACRDSGGSKGQLCTDRTDLASTCEYTPRFACFAAAGCERQANGACGFNQNAALTDCLARVADGGTP